MQSRLEDLTKEQLIAELNVANGKNKYLRDQVIQFEEQENKREFERRLVEATDFLKANGYEIRQMTSAERFPINEVRESERIWKDKDMRGFAGYVLSTYDPKLMAKINIEEYFKNWAS